MIQSLFSERRFVVATFKSLFDQSDSANKQLSGLLKDALDKVDKQKKETLMSVLVEVVSHVDSQRTALVEELRRVRKLEKVAKDKLEDFGKRVAHFEKTSDFGPLSKHMSHGMLSTLCRKLGVDLPTEEETKL